MLHRVGNKKVEQQTSREEKRREEKMSDSECTSTTSTSAGTLAMMLKNIWCGVFKKKQAKGKGVNVDLDNDNYYFVKLIIDADDLMDEVTYHNSVIHSNAYFLSSSNNNNNYCNCNYLAHLRAFLFIHLKLRPHTRKLTQTAFNNINAIPIHIKQTTLLNSIPIPIFIPNSNPNPNPNPNPVLPTTTPSRQLFVGNNEDMIIGRGDDKTRIVQMLLLPVPTNDNNNMGVVPIVGCPGIGKTTLARLVFRDDQVVNHFDRRIWVHVPSSTCSTYFDFLHSITLAATQGHHPTNRIPCYSDYSYNTTDLEIQLFRVLHPKLYLLVLDNLEMQHASLWDRFRLQQLFNLCGAKGSKVLITTRSMSAAADVFATDTLHQPYQLGGLSDHHSLSLFNMLAFPSKLPPPPPPLLDITQNIAAKCMNVPLAITSLAHSLRQIHDIDTLGLVLNMMLSYQKVHDNDLLSVLNLSYDALPPPLRLCASFCSTFPKNYQLCKHDLIHLWMSHGFLQLGALHIHSSSLQQVGEQYFQDLLARCFFHDVHTDSLGHILTCRMHDVMHDVVANHPYIVASRNSSEAPMLITDTTLHLSTGCGENFLTPLLQAPRLRTLLLLNGSDVNLHKLVPPLIFSNFKYLRALNLRLCGIHTLPDRVGDLIHLRYLDLSSNYFLAKFPDSITNLHLLQTLKLIKCCALTKLPKGIGNLVNLRCLQIDGCYGLNSLPSGLVKLTQLQTLDRFMIYTTGSDIAGPSVLGSFDNLRGRLQIEVSGQWTSFVQDAAQANLRCKTKLTELMIKWTYDSRLHDIHAHYHENLLEALQPPPNLKGLYINGYEGNDFPSWARMDKLATCLPNLVTICIECYKHAKNLPIFSQFQFLKSLTLRGSDAQYMENTIYDPPPSVDSTLFFPSLEELTLHSFPNLKGWWKEEEMKRRQHVTVPSFPCLSKLKVMHCPMLTSMPLSPFAKEIQFVDVNVKLLERPTIGVTTTILASKGLSSSTLQIGFCNTMKILPVIRGSGGVNSFTLRSLVLYNCSSLVSLGQGLQHLVTLEEFEIIGCEELSFEDNIHRGILPWSFLKNLHYLILGRIPKMEALPEGLKHVKALKVLKLERCDGLTALPEWIDKHTSLQYLKIWGCPKLTSLPPQIRHLKSLVKLEIIQFPPTLLERCKEPNGSDWPNIRHIPHVLLCKTFSPQY